jgi:hypothetical protein
MAVVTAIQWRRGTASQWTSANPTLEAGEAGYETDTGKAKIGTGSTAWNSLSYSIGAIPVGNITGLGTGVATFLGTPTSSNLAAAVTDETGTGALVFANTPTLVTPNLGVASATSVNGTTIPSSKTLTVTTDNLSVFASTTSSQLAGVISDETGSGSLVFGTSPTLATPTLNDPKINLAIDAQTGTTYTVVLDDNGQLVTMNNASANTLSIPTDANVNFPVGTQITVLQIGAGQTTIQAVTSGTTTIVSTGGTAAAPKLRVRYSSATCIKLSANNWVVLGDIS